MNNKYYDRNIIKTKPLLYLLVALATTINVEAQRLSVKTALPSKPTDIILATAQKSISLAIDDSDYPAVKLAAGFFAEDLKQVTGTLPAITTLRHPAAEMIIAGTIGKSHAIDRLIAAHKIKNINKIKGHWEASLWQIVDNPVPGVKKALIIVGSDRRGTVYGLLQISKKIGVSPWYWWADVPTAKRKIVTISVPQPTWDEPAVKYRGIFINDEDWGINQWARKTFEKDFAHGIGPKTYEKLFELMLRLRLNYIWPAMHEVSKEFGDTPENVALADRYGIVAGSSHCEPMLYNNVHWNEKLKGDWNYSTNPDSVYKYWKGTAMDRKDKEAVWTMGIRGIHDRGMESPPSGIPERITLLEKVFKDQRDLINQYVNKQWGPVAQCFVPYKEVLPVYDAGLRVPDDVTLIWVDDNFGYIRRLSNPTERKRAGGSGLYWHLSYYGGPHSYTWINSTSPALMWEEFHKAWENQARTMWVINVGDIKPMELGIDYFARLSWDPESQQTDAQPQFLKAFLTEHFDENVTTLNDLLTEFYRLGTVRKPELMNRDWAISLSDKEAMQLQAEYQKILNLETSVAKSIPLNKQDPYTEMIGFPARIMAETGLIFMHDRAIVYGANQSVHQAEIDRLKAALESEVDNYNNKMAGGKWQYMMPGTVTGQNLLSWNSQVAWPWGETKKPDTTKKAIQADIIRNASSADEQITAGTAKWTVIQGLGNSGQAMALTPVSLNLSWKPDDAKAPALNYNFKNDGNLGKVKIDFMPTFRIYPGMQLRVAILVDNKLISTIEVPGSNGKEDENGPNRNQGIRNNYVSALIDLPSLATGTHKLSIKAIDPGVVIDKISFYKN